MLLVLAHIVSLHLSSSACSSVRLRRAFDAMDRKRRGFVEPDDLLRYMQRERGLPAACVSQCQSALQRHIGQQRIGCASGGAALFEARPVLACVLIWRVSLWGCYR